MSHFVCHKIDSKVRLFPGPLGMDGFCCDIIVSMQDRCWIHHETLFTGNVVLPEAFELEKEGVSVMVTASGVEIAIKDQRDLWRKVPTEVAPVVLTSDEITEAQMLQKSLSKNDVNIF